eukprot:gene16178-22338_t
MELDHRNIFEEAFQCSQSLGLTGDIAPKPSSQVVRGLQQLATCSQQSYELRSELHKLQDQADMGPALAARVLHETMDQLGHASSILQTIVRDRGTLGQRFKDVNAKPTIPVESDHLKPFSELLARANTDQGALEAGLQRLLWVSQYSEAPDQWEQYLAPLSSAVGACEQYQLILRQRSEVLKRTSG